MTTDIETLNLNQIRIDGGTQPRVQISEDVVAEYAELYASSVELPPVVVFYDGATYWLADGFHRYWANKRIDCEFVFAEVLPGTKRDAVLYSVGANALHGLRRTNDDKRKAAITLLEDEQWSQWSDREIARRCGVTQPFVSKLRASLITVISENEEARLLGQEKDGSGRTYTTRHGTKAQMDTANIGRGASTKKRTNHPSPEIGSHARKPTRSAPEFQPRVNIDIPHDPNAAARAIRSALGDDFARDLIAELTCLLEQA